WNTGRAHCFSPGGAAVNSQGRSPWNTAPESMFVLAPEGRQLIPRGVNRLCPTMSFRLTRVRLVSHQARADPRKPIYWAKPVSTPGTGAGRCIGQGTSLAPRG